jgi:class 3 adenylate cyclase
MAPESPGLPEGTVTVLFTDLVGSTRLNQKLGDEAANAIEREVERTALEQVEQHRGVLVKDTGDGLMAAFQSARRAVACAQTIQRNLARRNREQPGSEVQMRIGLHTGEVIEESGNLHGETVIVAKRIESLAPPGGIFASDTVHGVLGTARGDLEDRGEFELKGIATPWRIYEIPCQDEEGGALADRERTPFIGRTAEREQLRALLERTAQGAGGLVLISGEAGAGKSRLAQELGAEAQQRNMDVLVGHCLDMDAPPPYQPLVEHLEQAARSASPEGLREALGENAPEVAKLMPELRQRYDDIPDLPALPPEQERRYLLHGVGEFVERAARNRPLLLVYEDLHWADESTLLLLQQLAPRLAQIPVLAIATYRHTELSPSRPFARVLEDLLRARSAEEIPLDRLGERDVAALLQARAGQAPPPELVELVFSETEGNPFFVEEVFRHLKEVDKLFDEKGRWRSGIQIADTEVPRGVRLVIGRRLERVSEACRRVLTAAAVSGRLFSFELLLRVTDLTDDALLEALEEAEAAHLIEDQSREREARYSFAHEQTRQTLLSALSFPRRQRLHLRIADAMEAMRGGATEAHAAELAHHLYQAGAAADPERTTRALAAAARQALDSIAFEDALRHVDAAQEVVEAEEPTRRAELVALRARAHRGLGQMDKALSSLAEALERAPEGPTRDAILQQRAQLQLDLFHGSEAQDDLKIVLEHAREAGNRERELATLLDLGRAHYILSLDDPHYAGEARTSLEQAYALAKELGDRRSMVRALVPTAWFVDYWTDYAEQARSNMKEAVALADALGDEELQIEAASAHVRIMRPDQAIVEAERLRELLEARRDPVRLKENAFWLMWQYWSRGELEKSVETCDRGIELAEQLGSAPVQYGSIKAIALADLGRFDQVEAALAQEVADDEHPFGQAMQQLARTHYLERIEAWDAAVATARDALERAAKLTRTWMQSWLVGTLATLSARMGARGESLRPDLERARDAGFEPSTAAAAELALADGRAEDAIAMLEAASQGQERAGMRTHWAVGQEVCARALLEANRADEARACCEKALARATESHMDSLAWRLRAHLARALELAGDAAGAERERAAARELFHELAARIADRELRSAFEHQPLARQLSASHASREVDGKG